MGKGSRRRPSSVDHETFAKNYEQAFSKKNHDEPTEPTQPRQRIVQIGQGILLVDSPPTEPGPELLEVRTAPDGDERLHTDNPPTDAAPSDDGGAVRGGETGS